MKTRLFKYIENFTTKKKLSFQIKILIFFHISAQNIDCGYSLEPPRRGGSNENPQSMFLSRNKKNNVYPYKPQFYYIKVGFKGGQNYIGMFSWCNFILNAIPNCSADEKQAAKWITTYHLITVIFWTILK